MSRQTTANLLSYAKVNLLLRKFRNLTVGVVGDLIYDRYLYGKTEKISLDAPVPVVTLSKKEDTYIGGAGNVSNTLSEMGANSFLISVYTQDIYGRELHSKIEKTKIRNYSVSDSRNRITTSKTRVLLSTLNRYQQTIRIDSEDTHKLSSSETSQIQREIKKIIGSLDALILQNYNKGILTSDLIRFCITEAKMNNVFVAVDHRSENFEEYLGCNMIKPNIHEAEFFTRSKINSDQDLEKACKHIAEHTGAELILITLGEKGMFAYTKSQQYKSKYVSNAPQDVTGAGEAAISAFLLSYISGADLAFCTELASVASSIAVESIGLHAVSSDDLQERIKRDYHN